MRFFFFFFLSFFLFTNSKEVRAYPCDVIGEASFFDEAFTPLATLFCEKKDSSGNCLYFNEDPGTLSKATVVVSGSGDCSGSIIELTRGNKRCETPFLLTAGHCVDPTKAGGSVLFANNKIKELSGFLKVEAQALKTLQKQCLHSSKENCLLTPQHILDDDNKGNFGGVDQALIPITNYGSNLPRIQVDMNSLLNEGELTQCFNKSHKATVVSYLTGEHLKKIGKGHLNTGKDEDHIRSDTCSDLSWRDRNIYTVKQIIQHRCPSLDGMSGSFFRLSCEDKLALLVYQGSALKDASDEAKSKVLERKSVFRSEYEGKKDFKNQATHIDPKLLQLYANEYCRFPETVK